MKFWILLTAAFLSCATYKVTYLTGGEEPTSGTTESAAFSLPGGGVENATPREPNTPDSNSIIPTLLEGARKVEGKNSTMTVKGQQFTADCIGTVQAVYYHAGIDLSKEFYKYDGNGVSRLYKALEVRGLIYKTKHPRVGDIIFWDNTWDRNGDNKWNDPLTHVGMVVAVDPSGQIEYIHLDYIKGNTVAKMNLIEPDTYYKVENGEVIYYNSPMRMKEAGKPTPPKWLSSHLVKAFGRGYLYRD